MIPIYWLLGVALCGVGCAKAGRSEPHRGVGRLWLEYAEMSEERALAVAGDPDRVWVGGAAGGHPSRLEAERSALDQCRRKRSARRLQAPCRLYAVDDEIVWESR